MPQPYLVPVNPITSRSAHNNGISGSTSIWRGAPLTFSSIMAPPLEIDGRCKRVCPPPQAVKQATGKQPQPPALFQRHPRVADDLGPFLRFGLQKFGELLRRAAHRLRAFAGQALVD